MMLNIFLKGTVRKARTISDDAFFQSDWAEACWGSLGQRLDCRWAGLQAPDVTPLVCCL